MSKQTTDYTVFDRKLVPTQGDNYAAQLVPIMTITAPTAAQALIIAKRKGAIHPIIGVQNV